MRKKTITIILALALCVGLAIPAFATGQHIINNHFGEMMSISNFTNEEIYEIDEINGVGFLTDEEPNDDGVFYVIIYATAPATITVLGDFATWDNNVIGDAGSTIYRAERIGETEFRVLGRSEEIPLATGQKVSGSELGITGTPALFVPKGSTFVLDEGTYAIASANADLHHYIIVTAPGTSQVPPPSAPAPSVPTPPTPPPPSDDIKVLVNGTTLTFDQPPVVVDGRTLVPLRAIFEALGAEVDYEQSTQTVTAVRGNDTVSLTIGSNILTKNGEQIMLDVPAQIIGGRTLVPARAIAESFGAEVVWDPATRVVTITE